MKTVYAVEQIRRMRGGAQSHLMRCSDDNYYVVKFQNNPQHTRVLVNEMLGTQLAWQLGLPALGVAVVEVSEELIRLTPELCIELPRQRVPCTPGPQFGSCFPGNPHKLALLDFLPDPMLDSVENLHDFAGMLVFDKWTCNTNGRQTLFFRKERTEKEGSDNGYKTVMIDQGFCFNAGEWNFPDAPLRGLYARNRVYAGVIGPQSFAPWLARLEEKVNKKMLRTLLDAIPPEWYGDDFDALVALAEKLCERKKRVPELLLDAKNTTRHPFPNWIQ